MMTNQALPSVIRDLPLAEGSSLADRLNRYCQCYRPEPAGAARVGAAAPLSSDTLQRLIAATALYSTTVAFIDAA